MTKSEPVELGGLSLLRDLGDLAERVRVREQTLHRLIESATGDYNVYTIKPNGKPRKIESPRGVLKQVQRHIAGHIANTERFPTHVCGGVAGR
ncbi:MAG: hypothetical protein K8T20_02595 [Planctomycetes bacterium]|nr:hypothetical protein [Planctomycetota bacterium]